MKNKKRKQERQARLERDDFENRIREEQTKHRHIDRTKVLLGAGGDIASDSEDEFDEEYQGQFGEVLEKGGKFLVVPNYSWDACESLLNHLVEKISGASWAEVKQSLTQHFDVG